MSGLGWMVLILPWISKVSVCTIGIYCPCVLILDSYRLRQKFVHHTRLCKATLQGCGAYSKSRMSTANLSFVCLPEGCSLKWRRLETMRRRHIEPQKLDVKNNPASLNGGVRSSMPGPESEGEKDRALAQAALSIAELSTLLQDRCSSVKLNHIDDLWR